MTPPQSRYEDGVSRTVDENPLGKDEKLTGKSAVNDHYYVVAHYCSFCERRANKPQGGTPIVSLKGEEYKLPLCKEHEVYVERGLLD